MIFRRYEIRTRIVRSGKDMEPIIGYRFFTLRAAEQECRFLNVQRRVFGAVGFEYYVSDRRAHA
jgi:hypothetical protein